ncbi:MAG TPA: hypothetical protein VHH88_03315 [Verrucomicrobiae bacterium]|nr:hypothetical protein [Verrucomicrobiae bacterium]
MKAMLICFFAALCILCGMAVERIILHHKYENEAGSNRDDLASLAVEEEAAQLSVDLKLIDLIHRNDTNTAMEALAGRIDTAVAFIGRSRARERKGPAETLRFAGSYLRTNDWISHFEAKAPWLREQAQQVLATEGETPKHSGKP